MAEGEGKSFENKTFETSAWDDDDYFGDDTTPFLQPPKGASTPQYQTHVPEEMEMKTMQQAGGPPDTSYVETSFGGAQTSSERAWVAAKDLFPKMSASELEVSYNTKGRLQVKNVWGGQENLQSDDGGKGHWPRADK